MGVFRLTPSLLRYAILRALPPGEPVPVRRLRGRLPPVHGLELVAALTQLEAEGEVALARDWHGLAVETARRL